MADEQDKLASGNEQLPRPELNFEPGELAPHWTSPHEPAKLTEKTENALKDLCGKVGRRDLAARRWEVEDAWSQRLFKRGYQYLLPRRGGGWVALGFPGNSYPGNRRKFWGNETNVYASILELLTAALTRDIPAVRWNPRCANSDADRTAKDGAERYGKLFSSQNDLFSIQTQIADYMCTDGRVTLITDHVIDAQAYGRAELVEEPEPVVPETEESLDKPVVFVLRHGETDKNTNGQLRGINDDPLNELGRRQAEKAGAFLAQKGVKRIICSPVARSVETAEYISQILGVPYDVDERLEAFDLGELAGKDSKENADQIKKIFDGEEAAPGGEEVEEFEQRVAASVLDSMRGVAVPTLLICHDSVISSIAKFINPEIPYGLTNVGPGGIEVIEAKNDDTYEMRPIFPISAGTPTAGVKRGIPRGQETVEVLGKLECKVPINTQTQQQMGYVIASREFDVAYLKAMFPACADKITSGGSGIAEIELDRIARINIALALEASYVTGDSLVKDVTLHRIWLRPCMFMEVDDVASRTEMMEAFPDGAKCYMAGDNFLLAVNECLDDHVVVMQALPGSGQNRKSLCSSIMPIQRRINTWGDLLDAFATRVVPQRYAATELFNVDAIAQQTSGPGPYIPFVLGKLPQGRSLADALFVENSPQPQPFLLQLFIYFIESLPQQIAHALPSLFGSSSNTDQQPMSGVAMMVQRDQALAAISSPWHALKMAWCKVYIQAVQLASKCRNESIHETDASGEAVDIELDSLKGNVVCFPMEDSNIPTSFIQKKTEWKEILGNVTNPVVLGLLSEIRNIRGWMDAQGLEGFKSSKADSYDKQQGELEILLKSGPVPNPQLAMLQEQLTALKAQAGAQLISQMPLSPEQESQLAQMEQQIAATPPFVSTVPVRDTDDSAAEAECLLDFIRDVPGRKLSNGTEAEQAAFMNVNVHLKEHQAKVPPPAPPKTTPKFPSINFKDLPADAAAQTLQQAGLEASGAEIVNSREFNATLQKSAGVTGPPVPPPVPPQAAGAPQAT